MPAREDKERFFEKSSLPEDSNNTSLYQIPTLGLRYKDIYSIMITVIPNDEHYDEMMVLYSETVRRLYGLPRILRDVRNIFTNWEKLNKGRSIPSQALRLTVAWKDKQIFETKLFPLEDGFDKAIKLANYIDLVAKQVALYNSGVQAYRHNRSIGFDDYDKFVEKVFRAYGILSKDPNERYMIVAAGLALIQKVYREEMDDETIRNSFKIFKLSEYYHLDENLISTNLWNRLFNSLKSEAYLRGNVFTFIPCSHVHLNKSNRWDAFVTEVHAKNLININRENYAYLMDLMDKYCFIESTGQHYL